jgi:hypothetical protein
MISWPGFWRWFTNGSREGCAGGVLLADSASGVQAVDDRVTPTLLLLSITTLRCNVVSAWAEWPEFVNACLQYTNERSTPSGEREEG